MKKITITAAFLASLFLIASCTPKKLATNVIGKISYDGIKSLEDEEDVRFAREASPALIKTLEVLRYGNLNNKDTLILLSKAYGQYTFGFLEEDMLALKKDSERYKRARERADLFYKRGREYGIAALTTKASMKKAFNAPFPEFQKAVNGLNKSYVPALFWTAFNWIGWLNLNLSDPSAAADLPRIEAMVKRALELDPDFNYGSVHVLIATINAARPKMLGGNLELSRTEFEKAISVEPNYLMTKVMFAQYYARQALDVELFEKTLTEVMEAKPEALPGQRLANELAKRRAKVLIGLKGELF